MKDTQTTDVVLPSHLLPLHGFIMVQQDCLFFLNSILLLLLTPGLSFLLSISQNVALMTVCVPENALE